MTRNYLTSRRGFLRASAALAGAIVATGAPVTARAQSSAPTVYGSCLNVRPLRVDPLGLAYRVNTRGVTAVYDMGLPLARAAGGARPAAGQWSYDAETRSLVLGAQPAGVVTADCVGSPVSASHVHMASELAGAVSAARRAELGRLGFLIDGCAP